MNGLVTHLCLYILFIIHFAFSFPCRFRKSLVFVFYCFIGIVFYELIVFHHLAGMFLPLSLDQLQSHPVPRLHVPLLNQCPVPEEACTPPAIVDCVSLGWVSLETSVEFLAFKAAIIDSNCAFVSLTCKVKSLYFCFDELYRFHCYFTNCRVRFIFSS